MTGAVPTAEIVVDLAAFRSNVSAMVERLAPAQVMIVVKADAYGHGLVPCAREARAAGAPWIGVATLGEALTLREAGDTGRLLCWLTMADPDGLRRAVAADIDIGVYNLAELDRLRSGHDRPARIHLKIDTGLVRGGCPMADWPELVAAAHAAEQAGEVEVIGIWSHLACADEPDHPANAAQQEVFERAVAIAREAGLDPELRHLANSAAALTRPAVHYDLVRIGIASYGLDPAPGSPKAVDVPLSPVMTVRSRLLLTKPVAAGEAVSYGHTWRAPADTVVGLVPVGYADGVPRAVSSRVDMAVNGRRVPLRGRVCMDQCVVELGPDATDRAGDEIVLFGADGAQTGPTAQAWAEAADTISYEIVSRVGGRMHRTFTGAGELGEAER